MIPEEGFFFIIFLEGGQQHRNQELRFRHVKFEEPLRHPSGDGGDDGISYNCLYCCLIFYDYQLLVSPHEIIGKYSENI